MEKLTDFLRFAAPPIITMVFVVAANVDKFVLFLSIPNNATISLVGTVLTTTGLVIVFGFLISSIANVLVSSFGLRARGSARFKGLSYCDFFFNRRNEWDLGESEIWTKLESKTFIADRIRARWNMALANINTLVGLILVLPIVQFLNISTTSTLWQACWLFFLFIFALNANIGYKSVTTINQILTASH